MADERGAVEAAAPILFDFTAPDRGGRGKAVKILARRPLAVSTVQVVGEGGENNLHSHAGRDGFWYVLRGQAAFYTTGDEPIATIGREQGVVIPAGYPYWFEATGEEELVLLQVHVAASAGGQLEDDRVDHEPRRPSYREADVTGSAQRRHESHPGEQSARAAEAP